MEDLLHEWNLQQYLDVFKGKKILFAVYTHGKPNINKRTQSSVGSTTQISYRPITSQQCV